MSWEFPAENASYSQLRNEALEIARKCLLLYGEMVCLSQLLRDMSKQSVGLRETPTLTGCEPPEDGPVSTETVRRGGAAMPDRAAL